MTRYDPRSSESREALAEAITGCLSGLHFRKIFLTSVREKVWSREHAKDLEVLVYTSIDGRRCRAVGRDAIRVCLVYTGGKSNRGCGKDKRVHRVGEIETIVGRLRDRINRITEGIGRCRRCGTPTFVSKQGKNVCAALCWTTREKRSGGKRLSTGARCLLARIVRESPGDQWANVVSSKSDQLLNELLSYRLIERHNTHPLWYRPTDRGRESYRRACVAIAAGNISLH